MSRRYRPEVLRSGVMDADVWTTRDLPVLRAAAELIDERAGRATDYRMIAERAGLEPDDVARAVVNLDQRYISAKLQRALGGQIVLASVLAITAQGLEATGRWPTPETAVDRLLASLDVEIDEAPEGSAKSSRLKAMRDAAGAVGRDVLVRVMTSAITGQIPT